MNLFLGITIAGNSQRPMNFMLFEYTLAGNFLAEDVI